MINSVNDESGFATAKSEFRKSTWSTPNTPILPSSNNPYGTWRRRGRTLEKATPSIGQKLKHAFGPEKQRIGKFKFVFSFLIKYFAKLTDTIYTAVMISHQLS